MLSIENIYNACLLSLNNSNGWEGYFDFFCSLQIAHPNTNYSQCLKTLENRHRIRMKRFEYLRIVTEFTFHVKMLNPKRKLFEISLLCSVYFCREVSGYGPTDFSMAAFFLF